MTFTHETLSPRPGVSLAYRKTEGAADKPGVIFCGGFRSDMTGLKASHLEEFCKARHQAYVRFDYTGHGLSSGKFEDGSIGAWKQDALDVFDAQTQGPQILVGSSMGGWIALLLALARKERIAGLVLLAPAPDFVTEIYDGKLTQEQHTLLNTRGYIEVPADYGPPFIMKQALFKDGRNHVLLQSEIGLDCPVRLLHSKLDSVVPFEKSLRIKEKLRSEDVAVTLLDDGDHRLSRPEDLGKICAMVAEITDRPRRG
jgi:alpha-beta hydrolase superfamily lysophospholipase